MSSADSGFARGGLLGPLPPEAAINLTSFDIHRWLAQARTRFRLLLGRSGRWRSGAGGGASFELFPEFLDERHECVGRRRNGSKEWKWLRKAVGVRVESWSRELE